VAATFGDSTIRNAIPYWLEQIPYTEELTTVAANSQQGIFGIQGWNPTNNAETLVFLDQIAATPIPGVEWVINNDKTQGRYDLGTWRDNWQPVTVGRAAYQNLSFNVINTQSQAVTNLRFAYRMTVWREPIAVKVLRGIPLTPEEKRIAQDLRLDLNPAMMRGTSPYPLEKVIAETYGNRLVAAPLNYALLVQPTPTVQTFHHISTRPNQLLVLRRVASDCNWEDAVTLTVDRDDNAGHVQVNLAAAPLDQPLEMFIPARNTLTFKISAGVSGLGFIPIRLEVWTIAVSTGLLVRMGQLTQADMQQLYGADAGTRFYEHVKAGLF